MYENSVTFSGAFFKFSVPLLDLVFFGETHSFSGLERP